MKKYCQDIFVKNYLVLTSHTRRGYPPPVLQNVKSNKFCR